MPWTAKSFASKHNHKLSPMQATKAAAIANGILKKNGGDEASAIRIANSRFQGAAGRKLQKGATNG